MDILVIDREDLTNQLISSKLASTEHTVVVEANKNAALDRIANGSFDCIMLDPAPLSEARPVIDAVWKNVKTEIKPFIILLSKSAAQEEAILSGANDVLLKPLSTRDLLLRVENAERFMEIYRYLGEEDDTPSTRGLINKSAFNQLFLSANNRAFRYGEVNFVMFFHLNNLEEMSAKLDKEVLTEISIMLSEKLNLVRRQSDVIGMIGKQDYAVLLQRPQYPAEPIDVINRFSESLDRVYYELLEKHGVAPEFEIDLVEVPQGILHAHRDTPLKNNDSAPAMPAEEAGA